MRIQGDLATYEFSDLLQWLAQGCKTGVLTVSDGDAEYQLGFDRGRIDMSSSNDPDKRLDGYLYRKGLIDKATLERGERLREATQMMSGQVLVTLGAVSEMQLAKTLRERTEEILCELLTWDRGSFEFTGGERPESTMVPISLEVTKLLLESMHRLDQSGRGHPVPPPVPAAAVAEAPSAPSAPPDATQAIDGLALAEVIDPESSTPLVSAAAAEPAAEASGHDLLPHYAVMAQPPGVVRRLAPYALVVALSLLAGGFHLANIEASAQAGDVPAGEPILFSRTVGPPPLPAAAEPAPAPDAAAPARAEDLAAVEEALRRRYEEELASLRQELEEARSLAEASGEPSAETAGPEPRQTAAASEAPAVAEPRVEPARSTPTAAAASAAPSTPPSPVPSPEAKARRTSGLPLVESPAGGAVPSPAKGRTPAAKPAAAADAAAAVDALEKVVDPKLVERPVPRYPLAAQRHKRGATIMLRVLVGADGRVEEVSRMGAKAGMGFDRAAEEAALKSTWEPGTRNGEPEAMWAALRFEFKP